MKGAALILALLLAAQGVAAGTMALLGHALQIAYPGAGALPWLLVGGLGVAAAIGFFELALHWQRWIPWLR